MVNHQNQIKEANEAIALLKKEVSEHQWWLQYHVMPPANWMNDPNGFTFYNGEYHLFYQHHPYGSEWGPMHWGHVKSTDLANWEHLPIALAPSEDYDKDGCFSGSAIEKDGKLYLIYTGNVWVDGKLDEDLKQVQAVAVSEDGIHFNKMKENPIITETPEGDINTFHFRDPKVWKHKESYYMVLGSKTKNNLGQVLLYRSDNLMDWEFISVMAKGEGNFGFMWECPDLFELNGQDVLVMSPQGVKPEGNNYHNLHQSGYVIGQLDYETGHLEHGPFYMLDHGFDFYAPQTMIDDKGRRILIAWMDMWESDMPTQAFNYSGAMTIPRLVTMKNNKLYTEPVPELKSLRENQVDYNDVTIKGESTLSHVQGDCIELDIMIDALESTVFGIKVRVDDTTGQETVVRFDKQSGTVTLDRSCSGEGPGGTRETEIEIVDKVKLQIYIDTSSIEVFINNGEKVMSARVFPSKNAKGITFFTDKQITFDYLHKWDLQRSIK